ncbi:MAG: hypothetical protein IPP37_21610 [Saprospiraceae bacterium]|nr:hypothetical protein [Saprospiraceae bacterium]
MQVRTLVNTASVTTTQTPGPTTYSAYHTGKPDSIFDHYKRPNRWP